METSGRKKPAAGIDGEEGLEMFKERKCKEETMPAGYYIDKGSVEKEAVERWENEGGSIPA